MADISMQHLIDGVEELGLNLGTSQLEQFELYYKELLDWNDRVNLTSITGSNEVQIKHFLDSLTVVKALKPNEKFGEERFIDVGAGAGFPGIPLKIALPDIEMVLLEATAKKVVFLKHIVERLGMQGIDIVTGRAEGAAHMPEYREKFDIVLSRAVAPLPVLMELTLPFCAVDGCVIAQKKGDIQLELEQSIKAMEILGGNLSRVEIVELEELAGERYLVVIDKVVPTPGKYPRRPGIPEKRPIT
jgi:16S rRNA (guanine527-N7)-methyltransferase